jgi:HEAT repeat protein
MLDQAFEALKSFDWGQDISVLAAIDEAVVATHGDAAARKDLEDRLIAMLTVEMPLDAKQFVCRKLRVIGTSASVPALAGLLSDPQLSHMARYALERIPTAEAASALRDSLPKLAGPLKVGVISSLGSRKDAASVPALSELLGDGDLTVARAAACALGVIRTPEAAQALARTEAADEVKSAVTDASLACAESFLSAGNKGQALAIYKTLIAGEPPKHVKLAATRGILACAESK